MAQDGGVSQGLGDGDRGPSFFSRVSLAAGEELQAALGDRSWRRHGRVTETRQVGAQGLLPGHRPVFFLQGVLGEETRPGPTQASRLPSPDPAHPTPRSTLSRPRLTSDPAQAPPQASPDPTPPRPHPIPRPYPIPELTSFSLNQIL